MPMFLNGLKLYGFLCIHYIGKSGFSAVVVDALSDTHGNNIDFPLHPYLAVFRMGVRLV